MKPRLTGKLVHFKVNLGFIISRERKEKKGGEVGIGMPLLFEFEKVTEYLAYFNSFSYMKPKSRIALD